MKFFSNVLLIMFLSATRFRNSVKVILRSVFKNLNLSKHQVQMINQIQQKIRLCCLIEII